MNEIKDNGLHLETVNEARGGRSLISPLPTEPRERASVLSAGTRENEPLTLQKNFYGNGLKTITQLNAMSQYCNFQKRLLATIFADERNISN
jgi:hypothetical protein